MLLKILKWAVFAFVVSLAVIWISTRYHWPFIQFVSVWVFIACSITVFGSLGLLLGNLWDSLGGYSGIYPGLYGDADDSDPKRTIRSSKRDAYWARKPRPNHRN